MTEFRIIEAREYHCGQIIRRLREEHHAAIMGLGVNAHREIRAKFDDSAFRRAWLIDDRLAGLGGVTGPLASSSGFIWLALTAQATRYPVAIMKEAQRQIDQILETKRDLVTSLIPGDRTAIRFATRLGFEVAHTSMVPYGNGEVISVRYRGKSLARAA